MTDITTRYLEAAILDQKVAGAFAGKAYAFVAICDKEGYSLGVAVAGEHGYSPIAGKTFDQYAEAKLWAEELNEHIGLSPRRALDIIGSSMFAKNFDQLGRDLNAVHPRRHLDELE